MSRFRSFLVVFVALAAVACSTLSGARKEENLARADRVDVALEAAFDTASKDPDRMRGERNLHRLARMAQRLDRAVQIVERSDLSWNATGLSDAEEELADLERMLGIGPPPEVD